MTDPNQSPSKEEKRWFPLESNPALLNRYASKLGFNTQVHEFTDVFSTESWALEMVPSPVSAVMVLFPMTDKVVERRKELHSKSTVGTNSNTKKESINTAKEGDYDNVWYIRQRIRNACGTIAVLHALANAPKDIIELSIAPSSWLHSFLQHCPPSLTPIDKAGILENDPTIETFHEDASNDSANQTSRGDKGDDIDLHFVAFVNANDKLYELDGRVDQGPVCHGRTTQQTLLRDACGVVKQWMEADPDDMRFTILALAPKVS
mmetsp:Transcript_12102/g.25789  ORF Transcript_12102/g.25789 Transcript_12102/m.25789 type:complete len:263 (+) Transcript_12102:42-830(+)